MCDDLNIEGHHFIVCGMRAKKNFCSCGRVADFLCDWKVSANKSGTCDAPICSAHAKQVAVGKHLCPTHWIEYGFWKRRHPGTIVPGQPSLFEGVA
jgi:hypothetical protein